MRHLLSLFFLLLLVTAGTVRAETTLPEGEKIIFLKGADGQSLRLGTVSFTPDGDGRKLTVELDAPQFQDEFPSMRPFRCLPAGAERWCHLEYPYEISGRISVGDLVDLEYSLLFLFKPSGAYGIDAWNGL